MDYYDFEMREAFAKADKNSDYILEFDELCIFIENDLGKPYAKLDAERRLQA